MCRLHFLLALCLVLAACGDDDDDSHGHDAGPDGDADADADTDAGPEDPDVVETEEGPVRGASDERVRSFFGIPYAAPPVGDLRWAPPAPVEPWTETRDALERGPMCPQFALIGDNWVEDSNEDCLTLNVWTPNPAPATPAPVMLWFHGGGFTSGSGGDPMYDGAIMAAERGVVVVTINYRLGPLGFLYHPGLVDEADGAEGPGNYGLLDQRAAMQWVRRNIAAFGGDAANVTIFGESAGGMSVCLHMVAPGSDGLFDQAIIESGPCDQPYPDVAGATAIAAQLEAAVGCDGEADPVACLRGKDPQTLSEALVIEEPQTIIEAFIWFPVIDGAIVTEPPMDSFASGAFSHVPLVLGTNRDEGTLFVAFGYQGITPEQFDTFVVANAGEDDAEAVLALYPAEDYETTEARLAAVMGDAVFVCPTREIARTIAAQDVPVFLYSFAQPVDVPIFPDLGAFHGAELQFIWGLGLLGNTLSEEEQPLADAMQGYWTSFGATGIPAGDIAWPEYAAASDDHMLFALPLPLTTSTGLRAPYCDVLENVDPG